jgi:hypothetical protein
MRVEGGVAHVRASPEKASRTVKTKCPMCRRKTQVLHTSARIRALAGVVNWETGVCINCYDVLDAFRIIVRAEPVKEAAR